MQERDGGQCLSGQTNGHPEGLQLAILANPRIVRVSRKAQFVSSASRGGGANHPRGPSLSIALGHDASKFDPDGPLPDIPESNASKSGQQRAIDLAKRENLTVRQLAQRLGGHSGLAMVGTPVTIAEEMEEWLMTEGSDGFTIQFPYLPGGLMISSTAWCRNCSGAEFSVANTKARCCATIWNCRGPRTDFFDRGTPEKGH